MSNPRTASAFAPASIGNVGVGFDMLGLAVAGIGDRVTARRREQPGIAVCAFREGETTPHPGLSTAPEENTAAIAAAALWRAAGQEGGLELAVHKGIPLKSGMGSSAASAVAAAVAVNALLDAPLPLPDLLPYALEGEAYASAGTHADNVAPSLLGGLILCPPVLLPETVRIHAPPGLSSVLLHPELEVSTADARRRLKPEYAMQEWLTQQGYLAAFIAGCEQANPELIRRALHDVVVEPQRADAVPCFAAVKPAALAAGALGCSLSGSGPGIFALAEAAAARRVAAAMENACRAAGVACRSWISALDAPGARVTERA